MGLENFDLSRWIKNQKPTKMSGLFNMDATLEKGFVLDQINMNLEMVEEKLFNQGEFSVHGLFNYSDSTISTISPAIFIVGDSYLTINGKGDFRNNFIDILLDLEKAPLSRLLDRMEKKGWIIRKSDKVDKRIKTVFLSKKIKPIIIKMRDKAQQTRQEALSNLSYIEDQNLRHDLKRIKETLVNKS